MIPNGSLLKQYRPYGVINVVSSLDCSANGTCQKPLFISNLLNTLAPVNWASVISTFGMGWTSLITLSFYGFKSTYIRTNPDGLGTMTMPVHQGVRSFNGEMTPSSSMRFNSSLTFSRNGSRHFWA